MEVGGQQALAVGGDLLPPHVGGVGQPRQEGQDPEGRHRPAGQARRHHPAHAAPVEAHEGEHGRPEQGEEGGDDVAQGRGRQQGAGQGAVTPRVQPARHYSQEDQGQGQADREGELPGQRGRDVAPVDGEGPFEQEWERGHGQARRPRVTHPREPAQGPGGHGQADQPQHRHQLEGDGVGDDVPQGHDQQAGQGEVERQRRVAAVPVGRPPRESAVGQEVVPEVGGPVDVGAHVPPRGGGVGQEQVRPELPQDEGDDAAYRDQAGNGGR